MVIARMRALPSFGFGKNSLLSGVENLTRGNLRRLTRGTNKHGERSWGGSTATMSISVILCVPSPRHWPNATMKRSFSMVAVSCSKIGVPLPNCERRFHFDGDDPQSQDYFTSPPAFFSLRAGGGGA